MWTRPCIIWNRRASLQSVRRCSNGLVSIVLRDVGPSLVGGWVLPHVGTIQQKHIRHAGEPGCCIVSP